MIVLNVVMITLGYVVAYRIDAGFASASGRRRWIVGLSIVPAGLQLAVLGFLSESRERLISRNGTFTLRSRIMGPVPTTCILVRRGSTVAAYRVLACMYMTAIPEEVEPKVKEPANFVRLGADRLMHDAQAQCPPHNRLTMH